MMNEEADWDLSDEDAKWQFEAAACSRVINRRADAGKPGPS
jgi:hypothetical protein